MADPTSIRDANCGPAAEANPADYQSRLLRVQILRGLDRMDEAVAEAKIGIVAVEKHLELNPDDARALHLGAGSLILVGEPEVAEQWLKRALEIDPNDSVVLYNVACNYAIRTCEDIRGTKSYCRSWSVRASGYLNKKAP